MSRRSLVVAILFVLSCCARPESIVERGNVLRIADLSDPTSLNPLLAHDQDTIGYDLLVCQTLIGIDERNRLVPILVTSIPSRSNGGVSPDGTRILYHLRHGVRFADGVELTSADVAFTYRAILDPRNPVLSEDAYRRIARLRTPNRYTVVIELKHPWNAAVSELFAQSDFAFGILPAHAFASTELQHAAWEQHPFGSGPFRVKEWRRGDRLILVPNPYFSPRPRLDAVVLRMIPDLNSAFVALRTHEIDVARLDPQRLAQARNTRGVAVLSTPENATEWLSLQLSNGAARDLLVRKAIAYALDVRDLRKTFAGAYPVAGAFVPPVLAWHDPDIVPYRQNVNRARALLHGRKVDAVLVLLSGIPLYSRIATAVQQQLAAAGIHAGIKEFPVSLFNAPEGPVRNARFTLSIDGWLGGADPEQSIVFTCSQANPNGDNLSRYCNRRFEALFADQQTTTSNARRRADFQAMQRLVHDDLPVIPLYYETYFEGVSANVRGFRRNMLRYPVSPERWSLLTK